MDAVKKFAIILDISDRTVLYDYVECRRYERPDSGTWDTSVFRGKGSVKAIPEDDENGERRVRLLDRALASKWLLAKKVKEEEAGSDDDEDDGDFSVLFEGPDESPLPQRVVPVYKGGDVVKGRVELELTEPVDAERVVVGLRGWAMVSVKVYTGHTVSDIIKTETFVHDKTPVWLNEKCTKETMDEYHLLTADSIPTGAQVPAGKHTYKFEFTIPREAPQSAPPMVISWTDNKGYLLYRVKAAIDKGRAARRGHIVTHKGLWVERDVDIGREPESLEPVEVDEVLEPYFSSGKMTVRVSMPRGAYLRGETVPLTVEVYNQNKTSVTEVTACIRLFGKARAGTRRLAPHANINLKSESVTEAGVLPGGTAVYRMALPWTFSGSCADGGLLPVGDLDDCALLDVNYEVRVKVKRKGVHRNMEINIPIKVGNVNSKLD